MAVNLPTIQPFKAGANPSEAWRFWRQDFEDYIQAMKYDEEPEKTKTALFRHVCGEELKKQYRSFNLEPTDDATEVTLLQILDEFDKQYGEYQNEIFAAFIFLEIKQQSGEKFQEFYSRLRLAVEECKYEDKTERMLRDKIIQGLQDKPLQERLLRETSKKPKTLKEIVGECKAAEQSKAQASAMNDKQVSVNAVSRFKEKKYQTGNPQTGNGKQKGEQQFWKKDGNMSCGYCGRSHERNNCPAYGSTCKICGFKNHWAGCCKTKIKKSQQNFNNQGRRINAIEEQEEDNTVFLGELKSINTLEETNSSSEWFQQLNINGNIVTVKLDTGAQVNVMPERELEKWQERPKMWPSKQPVLDYSENKVPIQGECVMKCKTNTKSGKFRFVITSLKSTPILGLEACKNLGLIKRVYQLQPQPNILETPEQVLEEFKDVFTGMGRLKRKVKIQLKADAIPQVSAPRKIPIALHEKVKLELNRMEEEGIIAKVQQPTEWVSNMVVIDTPKKLRICIDPRPLNAAIKRPHYQIPTAEKLFANLQGCKVFTLLDAKNGFWQLPLEEESSLLTTFTTPWGRYRFLVLPFGLNNAPEEFQREMDELFENEPLINPYFDDTALGSATVEEHCKLLRRALTIARKANLKFNPNKVQLAKSTITYLGHVISDKGIKPDPRKIEAIKEFVIPKSPEDLQRFLGMVTYQAKYTPHLSELSQSLRQLLKKDSEWLWDENTQRDFDKLKEALSKAPCLRYFDNDKPITVSVDASQFGMGAVLLQDNEAVAYGSATLTETQRKYAQIEKELLAVIFGLEHFDYYTYGRTVQVQTDHKPLLGLSMKPYDKISPRLQRMLLRLNRYELKLVYVPGKQLITADALSRAPLKNNVFQESPIHENPANICLVAEGSPKKWKDLKDMTDNDPDLQEVVQQIKEGWPLHKHKMKQGAKQYWHCREELHVSKEGLLCRGLRLVVPEQARQEILQKIHIAHRGIVASKTKAREYFYWPNMSKEVEEFVSSCNICQQYQKGNQSEPLLDREVPKRPWEKVGCDFFHFKGKDYLLMIDYFSKYIEIQHMHGKTAQTVISTLKAIYARHGIPEEMVSDQGPPFNSEEMKKFNQEWNIFHNMSSPHYPRSNGQVERAIQTLKNSLLKAEANGQDLHIVLLDYRITPTEGLKSPGELLMGRRLRSLLPSHAELLKPQFRVKQAGRQLKERQEKQKFYANQHTRNIKELAENTKVWFRKQVDEPWKKGTIIEVGPSPRTYAIRSEDGRVYTRNRFYVRVNNSRKEEKREEREESQIEALDKRTVEDFYPSQEDPEVLQQPRIVRRDLTQQRPTQQKTTRSGRTINKPFRYRT